MKKNIYKALTIAGSDPSGGAGIQADIKTFSALGVYAASAITSVVDENTRGVYGIHPVPPEFVAGQIRSVLSDVGADAVKIGMLHDSELILAVRHTLNEFGDVENLVVDPVMVATSGDPLLQSEAVATLQNHLIPYSRLITPNIPEASILLGEKIEDGKQLEDAAVALSRMYASNRVSVMLKAGHLADGILTDIFYNAEEDKVIRLEAKRVETDNTHGTGCTLSSAIAAWLAKGADLTTAVVRGKEYLLGALTGGASSSIGKGKGPVHHFYNWW